MVPTVPFLLIPSNNEIEMKQNFELTPRLSSFEDYYQEQHPSNLNTVCNGEFQPFIESPSDQSNLFEFNSDNYETANWNLSSSDLKIFVSIMCEESP